MNVWQQLFASMSGPGGSGPAGNQPIGTQAGTPHLLPQQYGWLGQTRPLGPGEYIASGGGTESEEDYTVPVDREGNPVKDAKTADHWRVIPGLWLVNGQPQHVSEDEAANLAKQSGLQWPQFPVSQFPTDKSVDAAFTNPRESKWESIPRGRTDLQPPLWQSRLQK